MPDLLPGRAFDQPTGGQRLDFETGAPGKAPFTFESWYTQFVAGGTPDPTAGWGYNHAYSTNVVVPGEPTMRHMIEGDYDRSHTGIPDRVMEQYWEAISADRSITWRPIGVLADRSGANGSRSTFIKALDLVGPGPTGSGTDSGTGSNGGIRFFSAKDGPTAQSDEFTYLFGRGSMRMAGFPEYDTTLRIDAGLTKNANIQLGANGVPGAMNISSGVNAGHITVGSWQAKMLFRAVNNNQALTVGINAQDRSTAVMDVGLAGTPSWMNGLRVRGQDGGTGNLLSIENGAGQVRGGFDKSGYLFTQMNAAPGAADLSAGQAAFWYDSTAGASRLMVTAKDAGGALVTGAVPLYSGGPSAVPLPADPVSGANIISSGSAADTISGLETPDMIFGNAGNDTLYGNGGADNLYGGDGNDTLYGGDANDLLFGGAGNDTLIGNAGADTFSFGQGSGADLILGFDQAGGDRMALNGQTYLSGDDGQGNLKLTLSGGGAVTLQGVASTTPVTNSWFS